MVVQMGFYLLEAASFCLIMLVCVGDYRSIFVLNERRGDRDGELSQSDLFCCCEIFLSKDQTTNDPYVQGCYRIRVS